MSSSLSSPAISPRNVSPVNSSETSTSTIGNKLLLKIVVKVCFNFYNSCFVDLSSVLTDLSDRRAPGCEKKSLEMAAQQNLTPFDYEQKKLLAVKAMQAKPNSADYRVPTSTWSGLGLSQSIPVTSSGDLSKV